MKYLLYTGEGLLVGWTNTDLNGSKDPQTGAISGEFYPNDFYELIRPTMRLYRWKHNVTIGELEDKAQFNEFCNVCDEIRDLKLYLKNSETDEKFSIDAINIEENDEGYVIYFCLAY